MISCGLTGGDSFSRNEGLVAVIYTCLSQFPKKKSSAAKFCDLRASYIATLFSQDAAYVMFPETQ